MKLGKRDIPDVKLLIDGIGDERQVDGCDDGRCSVYDRQTRVVGQRYVQIECGHPEDGHVTALQAVRYPQRHPAVTLRTLVHVADHLVVHILLGEPARERKVILMKV